ncbi:MAG: family 20 glycosylhydrolase [Firmicutes bacterium]|nr:family 20 glycosylhydrolase [Bacillota bacterium]
MKKKRTWQSLILVLVMIMGVVSPSGAITGTAASGEVRSGDTILDALDEIQVKNGDTKLELPKQEGVTIQVYADYEQVIGTDGTICTPLTDKDVNVEFQVTDEAGNIQKKEVTIAVPGSHMPMDSENAKPAVIPELAEWAGGKGDFSIQERSRIVIAPGDKETLDDMAEEFSKDYKEITGNDISIIYGTEKDTKAGDFYFALTSDSSFGLGDEGYYSEIGDVIQTKSETSTGAYWATRTFLQILKQNGTTIPKGTIRDYPKYKVRGIILDVGRKPTELDTIKDIVANMSWYKMNDLQIHLSDNLIFLEDYWEKDNQTAMEKSFEAYSAFRLESSVTNKEGETATSKDLYYTKEEFRSLIQDSRKIGVKIVPEIDVPAHALAFTKVFPEYALMKMNTSNTRRPLTDHLDLSNPGSTELVKSIFDDYIDGDEPVFDEDTIIHIGADEYTDSASYYRTFVNDMKDYLTEKNRKMRMWGGLTWIKGSPEVRGEGVQINIWSKDWAHPAEMYNLGFDLINCLDSQVYIVPAAGYYFDYLNPQMLYDSWEANVFPSVNVTIPAGDPQMIGGAYALWNDSIDTRCNGISDYDVFDRIFQPMAAMSEKLWGEAGDKTYDEFKKISAKVLTAPGTNPYCIILGKGSSYIKYTFDVKTDGGEIRYEDKSGNGYHPVSYCNVSSAEGKEGSALKLNGSGSYISTPLKKAPAGSSISFWIKKLAGGSDDEQILFETSAALGTYAIKAVQKNTGKVGFSREGYDYSFDYTLPEDEWVYLTIKGNKDSAELYVNGSFQSLASMDNQTKSAYRLATLTIPIQRIGSAGENGFVGLIDGLMLSDGKDHTIIPTDDFRFTCDNEKNPASGNDGPISYAFDGNEATMWHSNYPNPSLPATFTVDMGREYIINKLTYVPRTSGDNGFITSYDLFVKKEEEDDWTQVIADGFWASDRTVKTAEFVQTEARYMKFTAKAGSNGFASASEFHIHQLVRTELIRLVEQAAKYMENDYTEKSFAAFREALERAQAVLDKNTAASQTEIDAALERLEDAVSQLEKNTADKKRLEQCIEKALLLNEKDYTSESFAALLHAVEEARAVWNDQNATAQEVEKAVAAVENAILKLVKKVPLSSQVTNLTAPVITSLKSEAGKKQTTRIRLTFQAVPNAARYEITRTVGGKTTKMTTVSTTWYDTKLYADKNVIYTVRAISADKTKYNDSDVSAAKTIRLPNRVTNVTVRKSGRNIRIAWKKAKGASAYLVYRSTKKNSGYTRIKKTKAGSFTDKKAPKGKICYYRIVVQVKNQYAPAGLSRKIRAAK